MSYDGPQHGPDLFLGGDMVVDEEWSAERLSAASYRDLGNPEVFRCRFSNHLLSSPSCRNSMKVLLVSSSTTSRDFSLVIDAFDLLNCDPTFGHFLLRFPGTLLNLLENSIVKAQKELLKELKEQAKKDGMKLQLSVKGRDGSRVHARLIHLPPTCCKMSLGSMEAADIGKIVQCSGTVVRTTPVCMYESSRNYRCAGKNGCRKEFSVHADLEQRHNALVAPEGCRAGGLNCKGQNFQLIPNSNIHTDYQEVTIQETASQLGGTHMPRALLIKLQHDLVDLCQPGDEVVVVGLLVSQWNQSVVLNFDTSVGLALLAHSIRVVQDKNSSGWTSKAAGNRGPLGTDLNDDKFRSEFNDFWNFGKTSEAPMAARDYICKAVCPKLYGMAIVKLALLMTLIGGGDQGAMKTGKEDWTEPRANTDPPMGSQDDEEEPEAFQMTENPKPGTAAAFHGAGGGKKQKDEGWDGFGKSVQTRRRVQSHLLLVGDPGTGKSQFLRFAAEICPRSVLTTGVGTTSAGLTCAAVRENGKEFSLEAGALVLSDQGVCCIDEFGCIQDQDRTTIHEAMEQQTLSVAKAGIVCKLNCRATIIAVMNPKGCVYDCQASLSRNTGLGTPLLSRFDVIFKLIDSSDADRDRNVTTYLLNRAIQGADLNSPLDSGCDPSDVPWTMEKLRAYVSLVKKKFQPVISEEAAMILERHYEKCRSAQSSTIPVTVRFLESLIRLSQAHARLMYRGTVTIDDAVAVIRVMECSAFAYGGFVSKVDHYENILYCDPMTIDFSIHPDRDFAIFKSKILQQYGMQDMLTPKETEQVDDAFDQAFSDLRQSSYAATGIASATNPGQSSSWDGMESDGDKGMQRRATATHNGKRSRTQ